MSRQRSFRSTRENFMETSLNVPEEKFLERRRGYLSPEPIGTGALVLAVSPQDRVIATGLLASWSTIRGSYPCE